MRLQEMLPNKGDSSLNGNAYTLFQPALDLDAMIRQGENLEYLGIKYSDPDTKSLKELIVYGIRGMAAYAHHAAAFGKEDDAVYAFIHKTLASLDDPLLSQSDLLDLALKCGEMNLKIMELLDDAHTSHFGHPEPTEVSLGLRPGKCILVSGHDLKDLKDLLEQTEGMGINIYTHGEMLPAHGYPELKKYKHLAGHYGTAWPNQRKEFARFPGPILMTTNCIQEPKESYWDNIFTTGPVGWPGVTHLKNGDFGPIIQKALAMSGSEKTEQEGTVMVGFARHTVLSLADKVIDLVKSKKIKHFFLVGGCDGRKHERDYYRELVNQTPQDTLVLTLGCGKFRFFDQKLGSIEGIPRLLDVGQCNDAYSAIQIALALAEAFGCGVNDLPLSLVVSWYEQKAVAILLSLLYLGIKNIRLGPSLPAFISPNVLKVLTEQFGIKPSTSASEDLALMLS